jgi:hypothetical protein
MAEDLQHGPLSKRSLTMNSLPQPHPPTFPDTTVDGDKIPRICTICNEFLWLVSERGIENKRIEILLVPQFLEFKKRIKRKVNQLKFMHSFHLPNLL